MFTIIRIVIRVIVRSFLALLLLLLVLLAIFYFISQIRESKDRKEAAPSNGTFVQAEGLEIYVQDQGPKNGEAVFFIHGTAAWSGTWKDTVQALNNAGFRTIALDLPPFGFSERPQNETYSRTDQAKRIIAVADALGIKKLALVGHSFGGGATVEAAMLGHDKVKALILVDPALGLMDKSSENSFVNFLLKIKPFRDSLVSATITNPMLTTFGLKSFIAKKEVAVPERVQIYQAPFVVDGTSEAVAAWLVSFLRAPEDSLSTNESNYNTIDALTMLIWGQEDTITPLIQAHHLAGLLKNEELVIIPEVGHIPQIEDSEQFNNIVVDFLTANRRDLR